MQTFYLREKDMTEIAKFARSATRAAWPQHALSGWVQARRRRRIEHRVHLQLAADIRDQLRRDLGL